VSPRRGAVKRGPDIEGRDRCAPLDLELRHSPAGALTREYPKEAQTNAPRWPASRPSLRAAQFSQRTAGRTSASRSWRRPSSPRLEVLPVLVAPRNADAAHVLACRVLARATSASASPNAEFPRSLYGGAPPVYGEFRALNKTGTIRRQEDNGLGNLVRCSRTACRRLGG